MALSKIESCIVFPITYWIRYHVSNYFKVAVVRTTIWKKVSIYICRQLPWQSQNSKLKQCFVFGNSSLAFHIKVFPIFSLPLGIFGSLRKSTSDLRNTIVCSCDSVSDDYSLSFKCNFHCPGIYYIMISRRYSMRLQFNFWIFSATIKTQRCLSPRLFWLKSSRSKWWLAESRSQINMAKG